MTENLQEFVDALKRQARGEVRTDSISRTLYSTDASLYEVVPLGVFFPESAEDVQAAVTLAHAHQVPLLPRGGGSSLAGQAVNEALVIDMTRHLNRVLEINPEAGWARVEPGLVLDVFNEALRPHRLQFGPDPASGNRATMGGLVSNNSTGSHSILYGMAADHLRQARELLDDGSLAQFGPLSTPELARRQQRSDREGEIIRRLNALIWDPANQAVINRDTPHHWRRCGGYNLDRLLPPEAAGVPFHPRLPREGGFNLAPLMAGAEGTLGVLTELEVGLVPSPQQTALAVLQFADPIAALELVPEILTAGPSAVEMVDHLALTMCRDQPAYSRLLHSFIQGEPNCLLITEFYGESEKELRAKVDHLRQRLGRAPGLTAVVPVFDQRQQQNVWAVRKAGLGLLMSVRSDYKPVPFIEDSAVPPEHLAAYVSAVESFCRELGTEIIYYAHASAGCLHIRPLINTKLGSEIDKMPRINAHARALIRQLGGAYSSEHGDGRSRSWANEAFFGPELYGLYREVKGIFDPSGLFNPGNIVDAGPMTAHLRFGPNYRARFVRPQLDWSVDGGFDRAIEMCNGAGVCRKETAGTMCPSFMATRDEMHSTRGRANLLRAALSGRLPVEAYTGDGLYEAMDLCLSCKACKAECPSSVDMAKMKSEWLNRYQERHGIPLRSRLFAGIEGISRLAAGPLAPVLNWGAGLPIVRQMAAAALGIGDPERRPLPRFAFTPFGRWFRGRRGRKWGTGIGDRGTGDGERVVLFVDTFNAFNETGAARAAVEVLEAAGLSVVLPRVSDTGRPALSKGMLREARQIAGRVLDALEAAGLDGLPVIFLEPSELSAVVDDYAALLPDHRDRVAHLAARATSLEQFLVDRAAAGRLELAFSPGKREVLFHGHCHQKALFGTRAAHDLLALVPGTTVREVDSGCCGMAGSFGYETEHVVLSFRIGERRLLPAVRAAGRETWIVAAGVSCRQQILDGAGRRARHPAEFLAAALVRT